MPKWNFEVRAHGFFFSRYLVKPSSLSRDHPCSHCADSRWKVHHRPAHVLNRSFPRRTWSPSLVTWVLQIFVAESRPGPSPRIIATSSCHHGLDFSNFSLPGRPHEHFYSMSFARFLALPNTLILLLPHLLAVALGIACPPDRLLQRLPYCL